MQRDPSRVDSLVFPIIPWFAAYLGATVLGEVIGRMYAADRQEEAHRFLARAGGASLAIAATIDIVQMLMRRSHLAPRSIHGPAVSLFSIYEKFPPGPVYLGFFGGAGLVLMAVILEIDRLGLFPRVMNRLRQVGRAS